MNTTQYLSRSQAADYLTARGLKVAKQTLAKLAVVGGGPAYQLFGSRVVYSPAELDSWASARLSLPRRSTSQTVAA